MAAFVRKKDFKSTMLYTGSVKCIDFGGWGYVYANCCFVSNSFFTEDGSSWGLQEIVENSSVDGSMDELVSE